MSLVEKILRTLQSQTEATVSLLDLVLSDRTIIRSKATRYIRYGPLRFKKDWGMRYRESRSFYTTLHRLKQQGLVKKEGKKPSVHWSITKKGLERMHFLSKKKNPFSLSSAKFQKSSKKFITLVIFDIPEKEKSKRRWLRESLKSLEFSFLQKSVWLSTHGLPEEFLHALRERNMLSYIHIFAISKGGAITQISS